MYHEPCDPLPAAMNNETSSIQTQASDYAVAKWALQCLQEPGIRPSSSLSGSIVLHFAGVFELARRASSAPLGQSNSALLRVLEPAWRC